jgi:hypothetical protein
MGIYGKTAIDAVKLMRQKIKYTSIEAWKKAIVFNTTSEESRKKGCSRAAFIGLCEEGYILGIPASNTKTISKNSKYATEAAKYLIENTPNKITINELWQKIEEPKPLNENGQMQIVIALWQNKILVKPILCK